MSYLKKIVGKLASVPAFLCLSTFSPALCQAEPQSESSPPVFSLTGDLRSEASYNESVSQTAYAHRLRLQSTIRPVDSFSLNARISGWEFSNTGGSSDTYLVDRVYLDWQHLGGSPFGLSAGRLPTSSAPAPAHLRLDRDTPDSRLSAFTDIIIDGGSAQLDAGLAGCDLQFSLYAGTQDDLGYESGQNLRGLVDTTILGVQATATKGTHRFALQLFTFNDLYNIPEDVVFPNPVELGLFQVDPGFFDPLDPSRDLVLSREPLGDIFQASASWLGSWNRLDSFLALGWSRTDPENIDELGTGLLSSFNINSDSLQAKDGYSVYAGLRYDLAEISSKVGIEYNYGSRYWIGMQDTDTGKLATRGSVLEIYGLYQPELPSELRRHVRSFTVRLGYLYTWYDYTGSGFWLGEPVDLDELLSDPLSAQFFTVVDKEYSLYGAIDITF
jgi:hypothetical protein